MFIFGRAVYAHVSKSQIVLEAEIEVFPTTSIPRGTHIQISSSSKLLFIMLFLGSPPPPVVGVFHWLPSLKDEAWPSCTYSPPPVYIYPSRLPLYFGLDRSNVHKSRGNSVMNPQMPQLWQCLVLNLECSSAWHGILVKTQIAWVCPHSRIIKTATLTTG